VVGVRYEREDGDTPSFAFDYRFVEVKSQPTSTEIHNLFGEMGELKRLVEKEGVNVAARNSEYYVAFENEVPDNARERSKVKGYGVLLVETDEDNVLNVREHREPEVNHVGKGTVVSNTAQQSPGNFRKAVQGVRDVPQLRGALVLRRVMTDPDGFYDNEMRPLKEQARERRTREKVLGKDPTEGVLNEVVKFLKDIDGIELEFSDDSIKIKGDEGMTMKLKVLTDKIKFFDSEEELMFRVMGNDEVDVFDESIGNLNDVEDVIATLENKLLV